MITDIRNMTKRQWQIILIGLGALLLILIFIAVAVSRELPEKSPETTAPTDAPEPTLPVNPYGSTDFQYDGDYLTCTAGKSVLGVDVSEFQQDIDWAAVKAAGVEFAMIRLGYRGYLEGQLYTDSRALENMEGAKAAGLDTGAYFFSQAVTEAEAREEARFCLELLDGMSLEMPIVFDWEFMHLEARTDDIDPQTLTSLTKAFCQTVEEAGYRAMVYFNLNQSTHFLNLLELQEYPFWLAMYSDRMTYPHKIDMWQYSYTGRVPGIPTDVDLNLYFPYEGE